MAAVLGTVANNPYSQRLDRPRSRRRNLTLLGWNRQTASRFPACALAFLGGSLARGRISQLDTAPAPHGTHGTNCRPIADLVHRRHLPRLGDVSDSERPRRRLADPKAKLVVTRSGFYCY